MRKLLDTSHYDRDRIVWTVDANRLMRFRSDALVWTGPQIIVN
jgi:hypothetical protein